MTKLCESCGRKLGEDSRFCDACGVPISEHVDSTDSTSNAEARSEQHNQDWVAFLGPGAEYYLKQFKNFQDDAGAERFALTWNWYPFLFGWLWFLYRKMYLYALAFAAGPVLTMMMLSGGMEVLLLWGLAAGGFANYLYYAHMMRSLDDLHSALDGRMGRTSGESRGQTLADIGGVQPYVWWLGAGILIMALWLGTAAPPPDNPPPNQPGSLDSSF